MHSGENFIGAEAAFPLDTAGCDFVRGNPLFVMTNYLSDAQREDMDLCWKNRKRGKADYVTCWYLKTGRYIQETGPDSSRYCPQCRHKKLEKSYENGYGTEVSIPRIDNAALITF